MRAITAVITECENCGTRLSGAFCFACGQQALDYRRSLAVLMKDALDSLLNWDSRFFLTLWLLLIRPWRLTNQFLAGRRVRYVHPLRLYLLISIAFFFAVHEMAKTTQIGSPHEPAADRISELPPQGSASPSVTGHHRETDTHGTQPKMPFIGIRSTDSATAPFEIALNPEEGDSTSGFEKWMNDRLKAKVGEQGINARVFVLTLVSNLPGMMLFCIPVFAFVLKLGYIRTRFLYVDHVIYALHVHAFAYLSLMIISLSSSLIGRLLPGGSGIITAVLAIAASLALLTSLRKVYRQTWWTTTIKFCAGVLAYLIVLSTAITATLFITLALPD